MEFLAAPAAHGMSSATPKRIEKNFEDSLIGSNTIATTSAKSHRTDSAMSGRSGVTATNLATIVCLAVHRQTQMA